MSTTGIDGGDVLALAPIIVLTAAAVVVMLLAAFHRRHRAVMIATQLGLLLTFGALGVAARYLPRTVTPLLEIDAYALFFTGLVLAGGFAVAALAYDYLERRSHEPHEFYILLLVACLGGAVLAASRHFASFFLGVELLSVALFALIAYAREQERALEAGTKYLVLSGLASAFLLFGIALIYAAAGTMDFAAIAQAAEARLDDPYLLCGVVLVIAGVGFKLSVVPFHMWVADVYEGAPAPVGAFVATVSKGAVFAVLLRYFAATGAAHQPAVLWGVGLIAAASMLGGNLLALLQDNLKRVLGYSSVAHLGYLLVALLAGGEVAVEAVGYYLAAYFVTMIGAFAVITLVSATEPGDIDRIADYQGLFWRRPWLAGVLTAMLLSLAGIPVTMGFIAKFYIVAAGVEGALWALVYVLIAGSIIGLYYYLRIVIVLYRTPTAAVVERLAPVAAFGGRAVVIATTVLLLWLGAYPTPLIALLQTTTSAAGG